MVDYIPEYPYLSVQDSHDPYGLLDGCTRSSKHSTPQYDSHPNKYDCDSPYSYLKECGCRHPF